LSAEKTFLIIADMSPIAPPTKDHANGVLDVWRQREEVLPICKGPSRVHFHMFPSHQTVLRRINLAGVAGLICYHTRFAATRRQRAPAWWSGLRPMPLL
jgi:hypothetical protein